MKDSKASHLSGRQRSALDAAPGRPWGGTRPFLCRHFSLISQLDWRGPEDKDRLSSVHSDD